MIPPPQRPAKASSGSVLGRVCQPGSGGGRRPGGAGIRAARSAPLPGRGETESWEGQRHTQATQNSVHSERFLLGTCWVQDPMLSGLCPRLYTRAPNSVGKVVGALCWWN